MHRPDQEVAATRSLTTWLGKGSLAVADQGLIAGSNFLVALLLARRLAPSEYGAYALAFEAFLLLASVYTALLLEPMSVFGPSVYAKALPEYFGVLLRIHLGVSAVAILLLGGSAWIAHGLPAYGPLARALMGAALAGPCILLLWLARRTFYVTLKPQSSALGTAMYSAILLGGVALMFRILSPFVAFLLMAVGGLIPASLLVVRLRPKLEPGPASPRIEEVVRRHWVYGRWALASSIVMWCSRDVYYPLIGTFRGLEETGSFKALLNFASPVAQAFAAISLLSLPYAARVAYQSGTTGAERVAWKLTLLYGGGALAYWSIVILLRGPIVRLLYAGRYHEVSSFVPWVAAGSILRIAATAQAIVLRAVQSPNLVFVAYGISSAVAVLIGVPATRSFGLKGAVIAPIVSNAAALTVGFLLLRRRLRSLP